MLVTTGLLPVIFKGGINMHIIIHRKEIVDLEHIFDYFTIALSRKDKAQFFKKSGRILVEDIAIEFRCGSNINKLAGLIPNYFNTDHAETATMLQMSADKVNGREISDISELISIINEKLGLYFKGERI